MKRNLSILFKTFSFIIVILVILLLQLVFPTLTNKASFIGYSIGISTIAIIDIFWAKPFYVDDIILDNNFLKVDFTNPLLKKGSKSFDVSRISDFKKIKKNIFRKNSRIEFDYENSKFKFAYLKSEKKIIEIIENKIKALPSLASNE